MSYLTDFEKKRAKFTEYLIARGAEVLKTTNEYEVMRFRAGSEISVVYRKNSGHLTMTGQAHPAWSAFQSNRHWAFTIAAPRPQTKKKPRLVYALLQRDGSDCFYCGKEIPDGKETLEHMVPVAHGGTSHLSNLVLADYDCNTQAAHLSVIEKVKLREKLRAI